MYQIFRILLLPTAMSEIAFDRLTLQSWTTDFSDILMDSLLVPPAADDTWEMVVVGANVHHDQIDWPETNRLRSRIPWEHEVKLLTEAQIDVLGVYRYHEINGLGRLGEAIPDHPSYLAYCEAKSQEAIARLLP